MKTFFIWLGIQCVFARVLIGMCLYMWRDLNISPDYIGYFLIPATIVCVAEAVTSAFVVYPLVQPKFRAISKVEAEQMIKEYGYNRSYMYVSAGQ